jgi:hypothetical protein
MTEKIHEETSLREASNDLDYNYPNKKPVRDPTVGLLTFNPQLLNLLLTTLNCLLFFIEPRSAPGPSQPLPKGYQGRFPLGKATGA